MLLTAARAGALRRLGRRAVAVVPRVRHRPDRQRRPVPGDQIGAHGGRDRLARHARDAAVRDRVRHPRRLLQGRGRRRDPVPLHGALVDPFGAADRRVRADDPGLHRQEPADVRDRPRARGHPAVPARGDPGDHRLGGARAAPARRDAEALRARLRAGGARLRRSGSRHHAPAHPAERHARRADRRGARLLEPRALRGRALLRRRRRRPDDQQLRHDDQQRAHRALARSGGLVEPPRRVRVHGRVRAVDAALRERGARGVRSRARARFARAARSRFRTQRRRRRARRRASCLPSSSPLPC